MFSEDGTDEDVPIIQTISYEQFLELNEMLFKKLFVGDRRDNWNILIRSFLRKQVIILRPLAVHYVLHGVEGEIPLREYRQT